MKICIISPSLPIPAIKGGAIEKLIQDTIPYYSQSEIMVFSEDTIAKQRVWTDPQGIQYVQFSKSPLQNKLQIFLNKIALKGYFRLFDYFFIQKVIKHLKVKPDIFHLHNNLYYVPVLKKSFPGSRFILHMHNDFFFFHPHLKDKYKNILSMLDSVVTVSSFLAKPIITNDENFSKKVTVVHNGVSLKSFQKLPDQDLKLKDLRIQYNIKGGDRVIIFVGRICADKGVDILITAFKALAKKYADLKLLIVGTSWFAEGEPTPFLKKLTQESQEVKEKIIFTGFISHDMLNYYYNLSTLCVVPSVFGDPCPLVIKEAMASGTPLIGTDVGGIPEMIKDQWNGILIPSQNVDALIEKITFLLDNENNRNEFKINALQYVKDDSDWPIVAKKYEDVYQRVLTNNNG